MAPLARWCYRHRFVVASAWVLALVVLGVLSKTVGTAYNDSFSLPGTESTKALDLLQASLPAQAGESDTIVLHVASGKVTDPGVRERATAMLDRVATSDGVASVTSPYSEQGAAQVSRDGRTAYATVDFAQQVPDLPLDDVRQVVDIAQSVRGSGLQVELGGNAVQQLNQQPTSSTEAIGVLAAAVVLFVAFGSLFAMFLPLLTAVVALGVGLMVVGLASHVVTIGTIAPTLAALIGLGVGIDYALFIVTRHRNGLKEGIPVEESVVRALDTSGRAVLFAGATVCIALLGLLVLGVSFLNGMGIGAAVAVLFTVLASVTLLPALLGFLGTRVLSRRERRRLAAEGPHPEGSTGAWRRWADRVQRRPAPLALLAVLVMAVLIVPFASLRLGSSDAGNDPSGTTTRKAYDLLAEGFGPGSNGPLQLVAQVRTDQDRQAVASLAKQLTTEKGVAAAALLPSKPGATTEIISVVPTSAPQAEATSQLISRLRHHVIPAAVEGTSAKVYVGGVTAIFDDFAGVLTGKLPLFVGVIVGLGFLLLLVAFRSLLVPATAAVMNLLGAAASFGVVVAFFQWGWGSDALGLGGSGPVEAFLPVIMLSLLFGLSMDYQVFLVSRMHEEWVHTRDNARAVTMGQATTGRVITAAATIMICVFVSFVFGGQRVIAEFGVGLASAVLIDAFVIRTVLVPAVMHLFGTSNWYLPAWLDRRLPHLSVEPADEPYVPEERERVLA
ncbi:RND superfamily putative drug exporter [Motilibacter rhizosphaerae]|uniref:RND superfamily putative drug exporter n=1 Tax=Motilibacter rhizosphaerae TaxID=598652 RepID=A0A4Q7NX99_9ACTN|nr:MMPL family transporter [Motilibacter rhizosphaerae]RZS91022.1 RND superfamily putative drug exporter [Motilibacter rhizosphaerae]